MEIELFGRIVEVIETKNDNNCDICALKDVCTVRTGLTPCTSINGVNRYFKLVNGGITAWEERLRKINASLAKSGYEVFVNKVEGANVYHNTYRITYKRPDGEVKRYGTDYFEKGVEFGLRWALNHIKKNEMTKKTINKE